LVFEVITVSHSRITTAFTLFISQSEEGFMKVDGFTSLVPAHELYVLDGSTLQELSAQVDYKMDYYCCGVTAVDFMFRRHF
jgi:hypothetical protein